jgi:hypothetical protein
MDLEKKKALVHYLTEFIIGSIGAIIFLILMWFKEFRLSYTLISTWVFFFNTVLIFYWLWRSSYKFWEKSFVILYFILIEIIIIKSILP